MSYAKKNNLRSRDLSQKCLRGMLTLFVCLFFFFFFFFFFLFFFFKKIKKKKKKCIISHYSLPNL
jgi:predicted permease